MSFHFKILIVEEPSSEPRETKPANLVSLKTAASSLRDSISQSEKEEEWRGKGRSNLKSIDKLRRNLAELEAQLVLASPNLLFQVNYHYYHDYPQPDTNCILPTFLSGHFLRLPFQMVLSKK